MKKHCSSFLFVLLVVLFSLSNICVAPAAMKNLLLEFYKASDIFLYDDYLNDERLLYERDESYSSYIEESYIGRGYTQHMKGLNKDVNYKERLNRIDELIKQGLNVNDTLRRMFCLALDVSSINAKKTNKEEFNKAEAFCITLIKKLTKNKANFKDILGDKFLGKEGQRSANYLTNNLLRAFLDAGAEPQYYLLDFIFEKFPYKWQGNKWDNQKAKLFLERAKILVDHKVKVDRGGFGCCSADSPMKIFLKNIYLFPSENFTEEDNKNHFEYISKMIALLHEAGADTKAAKEYLTELREKYRNTPEALKYLDKIEKLVNKSSFCSLWNRGLFAYGMLFLSILIGKKKANKNN